MSRIVFITLNRRNFLLIRGKNVRKKIVLEIHCPCKFLITIHATLRSGGGAHSELASVRWGRDQGEAHYFPFQSSEEVLSLSDEGTDGDAGTQGGGGDFSRKKGLSLRKSYRRFDERGDECLPNHLND